MQQLQRRQHQHQHAAGPDERGASPPLLTPLAPSPTRRRRRSSAPRGSLEWLDVDARTALDPTSPRLLLWRHVVLLATLYGLFLLPFAIFTDAPEDSNALQRPSPLYRRPEFQVLYALELVHAAHMLVQLRTGFYEDGAILRDARRATRRYLGSWRFALDLAAIVPIGCVASPPAAWLEAHKLIRIVRVPGHVAALDNFYAKSFAQCKMLQMLVGLALVAHVIACVDLRLRGQREAVLAGDDVLGGVSRRHPYAAALYASVGLLTGVYEGDPGGGRATGALVWTCLVLLVGFVLFAYLCAVLVVLSRSEHRLAARAAARVHQLEHVLGYYHVPEQLQARVVEFLRRFHTDAEAHDRDVLRLLCPSIAGDLQVELLEPMVARIPLFAGCSRAFVVALTRLLEFQALPQGYEVFCSGSPGDAMYIVNTGVLHILVDGARVRELGKGSFFGEVAVFSRRPRSATVVTATYATLYRLARFHVERVLAGYPEFAAAIAEVIADIVAANDSAVAAAATTMIPVPPEAFLLTTLCGDERTGARTAAAPSSPPTSTPSSPTARPPTIGRSKSVQNVAAAAAASAQRRAADRVLATQSGRSVNEHAEGTTGTRVDTEIAATLVAAARAPPPAAPAPPDPETPKPARPKLMRSRSLRAGLRRSSTSRFQLASAVASHTTDAMQRFYDQLARRVTPQGSHLLHRVLLRRPIARASTFRRHWLLGLQGVLLFDLVAVPLQLAFPLLRGSPWALQAAHAFLDLVLIADVYVSLNLERHALDHETARDPTRAAVAYLTSGGFGLDLIALLPYSWALASPSSSPGRHAALRLPRLLRLVRVRGHWHEWRMVHAARTATPASDPNDRGLSSLSSSSALVAPWQRLALLLLGLGVALHLVACAHFGMTQLEGFAPIDIVNATTSTGGGPPQRPWLPTEDLAPDPTGPATALALRQYTRSLYVAATVLTARGGRALVPGTLGQVGLGIVFAVLGLLVPAGLVHLVQEQLTASAVEQKAFLRTRARIQSFLDAQRAPPEILQRVHAFLDFWWSSHRGAVVHELLAGLPGPLRQEVIAAMARPALQTLALLPGVGPVLPALERVFVDHVQFILYGQGETIYRHGDYASGLFFLLDGDVCLLAPDSSAAQPGPGVQAVPRGGFFGTAALHLSEHAVSYGERVTAVSGCILVFVSREHLARMHATFPTLSMAIKALERRILGSKLGRAHSSRGGMGGVSSSSAKAEAAARGRRLWLTRLLGHESDAELVVDPDAETTTAWDLGLLVLGTVQGFKVISDCAFGVPREALVASEALNLALEAAFLVDLLVVRPHVGFYRYGNKVMDVHAIRRRYWRSADFALDAAALTPGFAVNWLLGPGRRLELLNLNKLVRFARTTRMLGALETQFLGHLLAWRGLRLLYWTFLLAHVLGCAWFGLFATGGTSPWAPPAALANATRTRRHLVAVSWAFGLLSGSHDGAQPTTAGECVFGTITVLAGLGLLTYIVGNLADASEATAHEDEQEDDDDGGAGGGGDPSATGASDSALPPSLMSGSGPALPAAHRLRLLPRLAAHFALPPGLHDKLRAYLLFQRFHTITQEAALARCLPPSLLTDIRLVHLQPMIVKVGFLRDMDGSVTRMLVSQFQQALVVKDQFVCRYGETGSDMFFVFTGVVDVLVPAASIHRLSSDAAQHGTLVAHAAAAAATTRPPRKQPPTTPPPQHNPVQSQHIGDWLPPDEQPADPDQHSRQGSGPGAVPMRKVNELTAGSYFGEVALFANKPRTAHARARTSCVLYKLSRRSLELVFERYPDWKARVLATVRIEQEQQHLRNLYMAEQQPSLPQTAAAAAAASDETGDILSSAPASARARLSRARSERKPSAAVRLVNGLSRHKSLSLAPLAAVQTTPTTSTASTPPPMAPPAPSPSGLPPPPPPPPPTATAGPELWIDRLLRCTDVQSPAHFLWLRLIACSTVVMALTAPYRVAFDPLDGPTAASLALHIIERLHELAFAWDIWVNWNLRDSLASMELYEEPHRAAYQRTRLAWDVLAAFPIDHLAADFVQSPWLRLNRALKVANLPHYLHEIHRRRGDPDRARVVASLVLFLLGIYWAACACALRGDPSRAAAWSWDRALLRCLARATAAFVKRGRSSLHDWDEDDRDADANEPDPDDGDLRFGLGLALVGLAAMAVMVGNVSALYETRSRNEVSFRTRHVAVELYLERWHVSRGLRRRAQTFLATLWSANRGVPYAVVLGALPRTLRGEVVRFLAHAPLQSFVLGVFRPLTARDKELEALAAALARELRYIGYPKGEAVITDGAVVEKMFFVVQGYLAARTATTASAPRQATTRYKPGDVFGDRGLLSYAVSRATVRTLCPCDLLVLSSEALLRVLVSRTLTHVALSIVAESYREVTRHHHHHRPAESEPTEATAAATERRRDSPPSAAPAMTADAQWGQALLEAVHRRRRLWPSQLSPTQRQSLETLAGLEDPLSCLRIFESLLRLLVPHGTLSMANGDGPGHEAQEQGPRRGPLRRVVSESFDEMLPALSVADAIMGRQDTDDWSSPQDRAQGD